jgi:hypothetical protein
MKITAREQEDATVDARGRILLSAGDFMNESPESFFCSPRSSAQTLRHLTSGWLLQPIHGD